MSPADIAHDPEVFEAAIRKLRGNQMPPPGSARPSPEMRDSLVHWFETTLDAAAERAPKPGRVALHRLNRTEYANAVNDLFGLKVDVAALLPKDDESDGFDNIANVLKASPSFLEQYISRGERRERDGGRQQPREDGQPRVLREARHESEFPPRGHAARHARRNARRALLPGGRRVRDLARRPRARALRRGPRVPSQADRRDRRQRGVRERDRRPRRSRGRRPAPGRGRRQDQLALPAHPACKCRRGRTRSPRRSSRARCRSRTRCSSRSCRAAARSGSSKARRARSRSSASQIDGPIDPTGVGDTPSRKKIFVCRPSSEADEQPCAREILAQSRAHRVPPAGHG